MSERTGGGWRMVDDGWMVDGGMEGWMMDRHAPPDRKADRQRHRGAAPPTLMHTHHTQDTHPDAHTPWR